MAAVELTASGFAEPVNNNDRISIDMIGVPVSGTEVLFVCVGMVDAERPNLLSAEYRVTEAFAQPIEEIIANKGAGGNPFPAAFVLALKDPAATSGTVNVLFDEGVASMNGIGLVFSGLDTTSGTFGSQIGPSTNPQLPDFRIEDTFPTVSGNLVLDMCVTESSNHTKHLLTSGTSAVKLGDFSIGTHKFSTVWQLAMSGTALIERDDCGGPFAGATLTTVDFPAI